MGVDGLTEREQAPAALVAEDALDVLLVEDDAGDALLVEEFLLDSELAVRLRWVRSLRDARGPLSAGPDCVLLDLNLPDADGLEALRMILAAAPRAAVLVLTGLTDLQVAVEAVGVGAQDYLLKGQVDGKTLGRAIRYAVQRKQAEQSARALRESELRAAENTRLERGLLPVPMVTDPRVRLVSRYRSGRQGALLGGDFYDAVQRPDGTLCVVVGDVSGHGPDEAALGVALRIAWRTLVLAGVSGPDLLALLEQVLVAERAGPEIYATLCHLDTDRDGRSLGLVCAGHPPPLLLTGGPAGADGVGAAGAARPAPVPPTLPLGIRPGSGRWELYPVERPAGGSLLLYTDGLIDAHSDSGPRRFGVEGLADLVAALIGRTAPGRLVDAVVGAVQASDRGRSEDDIAVLHLSWSDR
jgi:serine phosphatase RsbU (regulator of sigma subunit)